MQTSVAISDRIYLVRDERVILDFDLAALYGVATKVFNQAVKRNSSRFPSDFMFQLNQDEWSQIRYTIKINDIQEDLRSQTVTSKSGRGGKRYLPHAFTEQGVAMLSGILNSERAIRMNIFIIRAFVEIRKVLQNESGLKNQLEQIKDQIESHDIQLEQINEALENLLQDKEQIRSWDERERIGFKN